MKNILSVLKETAVFMLASQLLLHFFPGKKYVRYGRMIVSLLVLSQLALPILSFGRQEITIDFWQRLEEKQAEEALFSDKLKNLTEEGEKLLKKELVQTVEERLEEEADQNGVRITDVFLAEDKLRIEVASEASGISEKNTGSRSGQVTVNPVEKIETGSAAKAQGKGNRGKKRQDLAAIFAGVLGQEAESLEVIEFE